jgi:signal transduction histidine kinase
VKLLIQSVNGAAAGKKVAIMLSAMIHAFIRRCAVAVAAWLPFFAIWFLVTLSAGRERVSTVLIFSLICMGTAGLLGIAVWYVCRRWPWPLGFRLSFYSLQIFFAFVYGLVWTAIVYGLEFLQMGQALTRATTWPSLARNLLLGMWFYAVLAGIAYAVQTRNRLHEKESLAIRAEALATAARLDALRARLNPHFLFNALHTLAALVKFRPALAESAVERLGDMLRYTVKEDGRELVEFSEEYEFTGQYLAFEQLRYEDRLKIDVQVDPDSFNYDLPPFSIQTLAENAVRHAISVRPEGGSIWISCSCEERGLRITVRDDGPGVGTESTQSHHFGLRSLRERLHAAYGFSADLHIQSGTEGFEATFTVPANPEMAPSKATAADVPKDEATTQSVTHS